MGRSPYSPDVFIATSTPRTQDQAGDGAFIRGEVFPPVLNSDIKLLLLLNAFCGLTLELYRAEFKKYRCHSRRKK